jgi:hypothetical protein
VLVLSGKTQMPHHAAHGSRKVLLLSIGQDEHGGHLNIQHRVDKRVENGPKLKTSKPRSNQLGAATEKSVLMPAPADWCTNRRTHKLASHIPIANITMWSLRGVRIVKAHFC